VYIVRSYGYTLIITTTITTTQKHAFHITFRPETLPKEAYDRYLVNLKHLLLDRSADAWITCREVKGDGDDGLHYHTAVRYQQGYDTGNMNRKGSGWRDKLLSGITVKYPDHALNIKHEYTFEGYIGYVMKEGNIVDEHNVTDKQKAIGAILYKDLHETEQLKIMQMHLRPIRQGQLDWFCTWAAEQGAPKPIDWLAERGFYSNDPAWEPSTSAKRAFLAKLPKSF